MGDTTTDPVVDQPRWSRFRVPTMLLVLVIVILVGFLAYRSSTVPQAAASQPAVVKTPLSQSAFEEQSGLRITLLAVTAAGGMVDFRFKVIDLEKATQFLQDSHNLPYLTVPGSQVSLRADPEAFQGIRLETGLVYYILYSNTGNLVKPGTPVSVVIGDWQLEPIPAK